MNEFKGTPGPWFATYLHKDKPAIDSKLKTIVLWGNEDDDAGIINEGEEQQANAHLIATAPELLEALKGLVSWSSHLPQLANPELESARLAIKKALGNEQ